MLFASYFIAAGLPACRLSMHNLVLSVAGPRVWNNFHQELHLSLDYLYISRPLETYLFPSHFFVHTATVTSTFLKRYLKAKRTRAPYYSRALNQRGNFQRGSREAQVRFPEYQGGRVAVKVGVVQMGRVNDRLGQSSSV